MKVVGYTRCSTEEQAVEGVSLSTQLGRIEAWCEATGAELVEVVEDGGAYPGLVPWLIVQAVLGWHLS